MPDVAPLVLLPHTAGRVNNAVFVDATLAGFEAQTWELDADDPFAYGRLLSDVWLLHVDLVVVEHDNLPTVAHLRSMLGCAEPWCGCPYQVGDDRLLASLGCCKFTFALRAQMVEQVRWTLAHGYTDGRPVPWRSVNEFIARQLIGAGFRQCDRHPECVHTHDYGNER